MERSRMQTARAFNELEFRKGVFKNEREGLPPKRKIGRNILMATGRISNETRRTILEMSAAGHSAEDIADSVGRNVASIARIIDESGTGRGGKAGKKKAARSAPTPRSTAASSRETLTHHFWLRPGLEINLELPANLNADEAQRLSSVILSLPFRS